MNTFKKQYKTEIILITAIVLLILIPYWQLTDYDFINFDDELFITQNFHVNQGIMWNSIRWAFSFTDITYWQPLTWLSHMVDCHFFGLNPGMHHRTNLVIHILNSMLVFTVLRIMTGAVWKSFLVAIIFGLHPVNVDSVAWISERKNVLSAFFCFMGILWYVMYVKALKKGYYALTVLSYVFALMSKPSVLTFPFILLLLDFWPLDRFGKNRVIIMKLISEKIPLIILSCVSVIITLSRLGGTVVPVETIPMGLRISNALVSYIAYMKMMLVPINLSVFYPFPLHITPLEWMSTFICLILITILSLKYTKKNGCFFTGWFWYLGTLFPAIGLVQGGLWPGLADRFVYIPLIGLFIVIIWGIDHYIQSFQLKKTIPIVFSMTLIVVYMVLTFYQASLWKNSETLFRHALHATKDNFVAHNNLGVALEESGDINNALLHYKKAITLRPHYAEAHNNMGSALSKIGNIQGAEKHFREAVRLRPDFAKAHNNLGNIYAGMTRMDSAVNAYQTALKINPYYAKALHNLGSAFIRDGAIDEGISYLNKALSIQPYLWEAHFNLGEAYFLNNKTEKAIIHFKKAHNLHPNDPAIMFSTGKALLRKKDFINAEKYLLDAARIQPEKPEPLFFLAKAYTGQKCFDKALVTYETILSSWPHLASVYYNKACIYSRTGNLEKAILALKTAIDKGYDKWGLIISDPDLDNIRELPEFRKILIK